MTGATGGGRRAAIGRRAAVGVVCLAGGLLLGTARSYSVDHDTRTVSADLRSLVVDAERRVAQAQARAAALQQGIDAAAARDSSPDAAVARARVEQLAVPAQLTPVVGPGLRVALDDAPRDADGNYPLGVNPDDLVVHQQDVQAVVNALWAGGAEAMTIMDQRVIATSAVRCIGNTLLLQGRTYSPPFVVTAIGPADAMRAALDAEPGVQLYRRYVDRFGLGLDVEPQNRVTLPGYTDPVPLTAAEPVR